MRNDCAHAPDPITVHDRSPRVRTGVGVAASHDQHPTAVSRHRDNPVRDDGMSRLRRLEGDDLAGSQCTDRLGDVDRNGTGRDPRAHRTGQHRDGAIAENMRPDGEKQHREHRDDHHELYDEPAEMSHGSHRR